MEFKIERNTISASVKIIDGNTVIDLGYLFEKDRLNLAHQLEQVVDELTEGDRYDR